MIAVCATDEFQNKARLRAELDHRTAVTPALLHSIDEHGRLISVSDAWLAKLGYTRDEVLGRSSADFLTPASREYAVNEVMPEFFRTGRCENIQYQMVCKDGRTIDVLISAVLEDNPSGEGRMSLAVITDITALKKVERLLAESEARYRFLAEHSADMIVLTGHDGQRYYASPACRTLLGYEPPRKCSKFTRGTPFIRTTRRRCLKPWPPVRWTLRCRSACGARTAATFGSRRSGGRSPSPDSRING